MRQFKYIILFYITLMACLVHGQESPTCFDFQRIEVPLKQGEFKTSPADVFFQPANLLEYREKDAHTFWYLLEAKESTEIRFSIFSLNYIDIYDPLVFSNQSENICTQIVGGTAAPIPISGLEAYSYGDSLNRQNVREFSFMAEGGIEYYVGVIEIFGESCGHKLFINTENRSAIFKAKKGDCILPDDLVHLDVKSDLSHLEDTGLMAPEADTKLTNKESIPEPKLEELPFDEDPQSLDYEPIELAGQTQSKPEAEEATDLSKELFQAIETLENDSLTGLNINDTSTLVPLREEVSVMEKVNLDEINFRDWKTGEIIPLDSIAVGQQIVLNKIYFHNNTFAFKFPAQYELEKLADFLLSNPNVKLEIQGHSAGNTKRIQPDPRYKARGTGWDFKGSSLELSEERAIAVKDFLVSKGIESPRLSTLGMGDKKKLINSPRSIDEARLNMRVEIVFTDR